MASTETGPLAIVRAMYDAFGRRDTDEVRRLLDPEIEWVQNEGFPDGGRHVGVEAVLEGVFARFRREWRAWRAHVEEWHEAGGTVIAIGAYRGVNIATSRHVDAAFAHVYDVRDGRIVRFRQFTDTALIERAMRG